MSALLSGWLLPTPAARLFETQKIELARGMKQTSAQADVARSLESHAAR